MIITTKEAFVNTIFREIVIIAAWSIWKHRNSIIFDEESLSFNKWRLCFFQDMSLVTLRVPDLKDNVWLSSL
ncbi:hypothetical protein HU200_045528 [Digitaria exilis]|uniref:RNA-directed DNA polymerase, eukaryota n=1 Tax=Digitaria exilis TaxID=1010633 RepID=A0A835B7Q2_9POAL|nr:hypothetical protein HU200_045528 [Digitaria exilis]